MPGILVDVGTTREYPFGPTLAHVVGYVAPPNEADVCGRHDAVLAWHPGRPRRHGEGV